MPSRETLDRVKRIVVQSLKLDAATSLDDQTPLMGGEYEVDSLDVLLMVTNVEREFGFKIADRQVDPQMFQSVHSLAEFVEGRKP